jgi:LacI family transcriptional regulator
MKRKAKEIDSEAIAKLVGVSRSTVSKVINNYPSISTETRERVLKVIKEYGYFPNLSARILAGKGTDTLGFFFFDQEHFSDDILVNAMISSVIEHSAAFGYHILCYIVRDPETEKTKRMVREVFHQQRVEGGIIIGARNHEPLVEELISEGFVLGVFDQDLPGKHERNRVVVNFEDKKTSMASMRYLFSLGHRKIGVINGDLRRSAGLAKQAGFLEAAGELGLDIRPEWTLYTNFSELGGYDSMRKFLAGGGELPTAFAAANDTVAFGALRALRERKIDVPGDVSIVGVDGHPLSQYIRPTLTTFQYDFELVMGRLVELIIAKIEDPDLVEQSRELFSPVFMERESCRRLAAAGDPAWKATSQGRLT